MPALINTAKKFIVTCWTIVGLGVGAARAQRPDIVIADFEAPTYGDWSVTGTAFGSGPAQGTLPNQMPVSGYRGRSLVNSYNGGDDATGTLSSKPFRIERKFIQFLIGGGGWEGKTCMNLLLDGRVVRTATGPNTQPGSTEQLTAQQWDTSELLNQSVTLQIVDQATGTWGHITIDQIVQTDRKLSAPVPRETTLRVRKDYLNLPVKDGAPKRRMSVWLDGKARREFDIELADDKPDWWAFLDATPFKGKTVTLKVDKLPEDSL
ncbi:MAG TPA: 2,6-beta-D-fructofuranosidase, partial [Methylomirabilota bacterium]|nr:2,6-beta-D-fructofuranosidase [Methylomirabilota bacterium]